MNLKILPTFSFHFQTYSTFDAKNILILFINILPAGLQRDYYIALLNYLWLTITYTYILDENNHRNPSQSE